MVTPPSQGGAGGGYLVTDYFLLDHLGNTRMVLTDDSAQADYPVLQETHYYPFGMAMKGISFNRGDSPNRYLYNGGTELNGDFDIDLYETPNRGYDAQLGRFWQQDGLADSYSGITPYQFGFNNPVSFNDPSGLDPNWMNPPGTIGDPSIMGYNAWMRLNNRDPYENAPWNMSAEQYVNYMNDIWSKQALLDREADVLSSDPSAIIVRGSVKLQQWQTSSITYVYNGGGAQGGSGGSEDQSSGWGSIGRTVAGFVPVLGGGLDIYDGIKEDNGWKVALGVVSIGLDIFTLGSSSLAEGALKTAGEELIKEVASKGSTTIYRAVSKAELDDIAQFGFRTKAGGYETGKLFAPTFKEAAQFGKNNFMFDGIPNTIMKVRVPNNVLNGAYKFGADGMNAISIPANQLNLLKGTPVNFSPWLR